VKRKSIEFRAIYAPILSKFYFIFLLSNTHEQIFIILVEVEIKSIPIINSVPAIEFFN